MNTPVVLFNFRRPNLSLVALNQLARIGATRVYLVCDGPKLTQDIEDVSQVRQLIVNYSESNNWETIISPYHLGLRDRFYSALDEIFQKEETAIILEDDCQVDEFFFRFADQALIQYKNIDQIGIISAHNPTPIRENKVIFSSYPRIWGWATWDRTWKAFQKWRTIVNLGEQIPESDLLKIQSYTARFQLRNLMRSKDSFSTWDLDFVRFFLQNSLVSVSSSSNLVKNVGGEFSNTNSNDWMNLELPKIRTFSELPSFSLPTVKTKSQALREDFLRSYRWVLAAVRNPLKATSKVIQIVIGIAKFDQGSAKSRGKK